MLYWTKNKIQFQSMLLSESYFINLLFSLFERCRICRVQIKYFSICNNFSKTSNWIWSFWTAEILHEWFVICDYGGAWKTETESAAANTGYSTGITSFAECDMILRNFTHWAHRTSLFLEIVWIIIQNELCDALFKIISKTSLIQSQKDYLSISKWNQCDWK